MLKECKINRRWSVDGNVEITSLGCVPEIVNSSRQLADVIVWTDDKSEVALTAEVHNLPPNVLD